MKTRLLSLIPALAIAIAGIVMVCRQRTEMIAMEETVSRRVQRNAPGIAATSSSPPVTPSTDATAARRTGEQHAAAFLAGLNEKARPLVEKTERDSAANRARFMAERAALLLSLTTDEKSALQKHLETQPAQNSAAHDWIAEHCRAEQLAAFDAAENARHTAEVEHKAQEAIYRLSRIVDLTPEQKDRLYAGFVSKAAAAPAAGPAPMALRTEFSVSDTPQIANPAALARPILTPQQLALFNAAVEQESKVIRESTQSVMGQLLPVFISAMQEAAAAKE